MLLPAFVIKQPCHVHVLQQVTLAHKRSRLFQGCLKDTCCPLETHVQGNVQVYNASGSLVLPRHVVQTEASHRDAIYHLDLGAALPSAHPKYPDLRRSFLVSVLSQLQPKRTDLLTFRSSSFGIPFLVMAAQEVITFHVWVPFWGK